MRKNPAFKSGFINARVVIAFALCSGSGSLAIIAAVAASSGLTSSSAPSPPVICGRAAPIPGNERCPLWQSVYNNAAGNGVPERAQAIALSPDGLVVYVTG